MSKIRNNISFIILATLLSSPVFAEDKVRFSVSAGIEYDDNISVATLDQTTGESDIAAVLDFSAAYTPIKTSGTEIELNYDFYQSLHETFDDFDLQIHTFSALGSWEVGGYDAGLSYGYSRVYLGANELYDSHTVTPSLGFSGTENWYHLVSYAYQDKDFGAISGRNAEQNSISFDNFYFFMDNKANVLLSLRAEDENAKDGELDYQGTTLKVGLSAPLMDTDLTIKASYQHYWRDYDNTTASISEKRNDEQGLVNIDLIKPLGEGMNVKLSYEHINAESNLASADYSGNVVTVNFNMYF